MPNCDDDSTSDCSSVSSIEEYTPAARRVPPARTHSMVTKPTFASSKPSTRPAPVSESDSDDDSDSSDDDENAKTKKPKSVVRKAPARATSMPIARKTATSPTDVYINESTLMMSKQAADMAATLKKSLDAASVHSRDMSEVEPVIDFTADCDDFKVLALKPKKDKTKKKKKKDDITIRDLGQLSIEAKKEERMERVRQRIEAEEDRKQKEVYEAKMKQLEANKADMSEAGRRRRCWEWYSRTGMISKVAFIEKLPYLPPAAELEEADVELLPWNARGTMVNVAKLNGMLLSS